MTETLVLRVVDREALLREHRQNFAHGRAFVPGAEGPPLFSLCQLLIEHPSHAATFAVQCEVVMILDQGAVRGVALQFKDPSPKLQAQLTAFVANEDTAAELASDDALASAELEGRDEDEAADSSDEGDCLLDDESDGEGRMTSAERVAPQALTQARERQQRLRNLSLNDRLKIARGPSLEDRILLERIYGANVWEPLLHNPKITVPEVARLAKKGTMPRPLLEFIVENEQWIRQSVVRRALLTNPRLSPEGAAKVLRTLPARELKLVPQQTAYPATVRAVATRLMRGG